MKTMVMAADAGVALLGGAARAEVLNNATIIDSPRTGLSPGTIVAKINASPTSFDLDAPHRLALKQAGAAEPVITPMLSPPESNRPMANPAIASGGSIDPVASHAVTIDDRVR